MHNAGILLSVRRLAGALGPVALSFLVACSGRSEQTSSADTANPPAGSLRAIMQSMDTAASEIAGGIWTEDHDRMRAGAAAIADHPPIPGAEKEIIQAVLGEEFAAFARLDQYVHEMAVDLGRLAEDRAAIGETLGRFHQLQTGCVGCHTAFRPRVAAALP